MLNAQTMKSMDDRHLVSALYAELDPLASTAAEAELLHRLEMLLDELADRTPLENAMAEASLEYKDIPPILETMVEFSCYDAKDLRQKLERADKFYDIAQEAGDVIDQLNTLIQSTV